MDREVPMLVSHLGQYRHFLLVVAPVSLAIIAIVLFEGDLQLDLKCDFSTDVARETTVASRQFNEATAHLFWLAAYLLEIAAGIATCIFVSYVIYKMWGWQRAKQLGCLVAVALLASVLLSVVRVGGGRFSPKIFFFTHDALLQYGYEGAFAQRIFRLQTAVNIIGAAATFLGLVGVSITLRKPEEDRNDLTGFYVDRLKYQSQGMYLVSIFLATGVLQMSAWMQWPTALVDGDATPDSIKALSLAVSSYWGVAYSLVIVATFLPAAMILRERLYRVLEFDEQVESPDAWLKERGLVVSPAQHLRQIVAVLGPVLAVPMGKFLSSLSG